MSELEQKITERVEEVKEDLELQAGYQLSDDQVDELRLTGRTGIDIAKFAPYLKKVTSYINSSDDEDTVWYILLNTIDGDVEITLKGCHIVL